MCCDPDRWRWRLVAVHSTATGSTVTQWPSASAHDAHRLRGRQLPGPDRCAVLNTGKKRRGTQERGKTQEKKCPSRDIPFRPESHSYCPCLVKKAPPRKRSNGVCIPSAESSTRAAGVALLSASLVLSKRKRGIKSGRHAGRVPRHPGDERRLL